MGNGDPNISEGCSYGQVSRNQIENMESKLSELTGWMQRLEDRVLEAISLAAKRPGWATLVIISILSSAVVGLLVALVTMWAKTGVSP